MHGTRARRVLRRRSKEIGEDAVIREHALIVEHKIPAILKHLRKHPSVVRVHRIPKVPAVALAAIHDAVREALTDIEEDGTVCFVRHSRGQPARATAMARHVAPAQGRAAVRRFVTREGGL